jgi:SOS response regulatory protein OraA/RecX
MAPTTPTDGEEMAEVISFPDRAPSPSHAPTAWPGTVIDLETARKMAGVSVEEAPAPQPVVEKEDEPEHTSARQIALRTLAAKGRSVGEVRAKLRDRGIDADVIDTEIERLQAEGLLNDTDLAEQLVWSLTEHKKLGPVAVRQALIKRKIPGAIIDQVVPSASDVAPDVIEQIAIERMRVLRGLEPDVQKRRLLGFLARRGYSGSEVYRVVDRAVAGA